MNLIHKVIDFRGIKPKLGTLKTKETEVGMKKIDHCPFPPFKAFLIMHCFKFENNPGSDYL